MSEILPSDFDGVFRFTNFTDEEFKAKWDGKEYTFPANKTTPMVMNATPQEIQHIRKKFARELAIQEFYKSKKFEKMNVHTPGGNPPTYTESDIAPYSQRCLEPLPIAQATVRVLPKDSEKNYVKDNKGRNVTKVLEEGESLMAQASNEITL